MSDVELGRVSIPVYAKTEVDVAAGEIHQQADRVAAQIERLRDAIEVQGQRLGHVLGPIPDVESELAEVKADPSSLAPLGVRLDQFADQIEALTSQLMHLTRRLQV